MADPLLSALNNQEKDFKTPPVVSNEPPVSNDTPPAVNNAAPPVTTTPPAKTEAGQPDASAPTFNEGEYLKTHFGVEKLDDVKTKWSGLSQLEEQNRTLAQEVEKYKPAYETLDKGGEVAKLFADSIAKGIDPKTLAQIYNLKPEELNEEQAWKINAKLNKPYLKDEQINALYNHKFHVADDETDETVKILKAAELAEESNTARSGIKDFIGKTLKPTNVPDPAVEQAAAKARTEELQKTWTGHLPTLANGLKEVSVKVPMQTFGAKAGETTDVDVKYILSDAEQKAVMDEAFATAIRQGVTPDEKGMKSIQDYAARVTWASYGNKIVQGAVADAVTAMTTQFEKMMNNPQLARNIAAGNLTKQTDMTSHEQSLMAGMKKQNRSTIPI